MMNHLKVAWGDYVRPMFQRPKRLQVAALCIRDGKKGRQVLLVTSRGTGRWILPKGWPIRGKDAAGSALQEAWEEAGVAAGRSQDKAIGTYTYSKSYPAGMSVPVETLVFPVTVEKMSDRFPEAHERKRKWVSTDEAANMVSEPELKTILRDL